MALTKTILILGSNLMILKKIGLVVTLVCSSFFVNTAQAAIIDNSFTLELVADNDFAVFAGKQDTITSILYQNNSVWNQQIIDLQNLFFTLGAGNDTFYVLAMGGGAVESLSGRVNGVNITSAAVGAVMSNNINVNNQLFGYNSTAVANGTYDVRLVDVQQILSSLTWSQPAITYNQVVVNESGFGSGFTFGSNSAHLFRFAASDVNVPVVDVAEPSMLAMMGLALLALVARNRRSVKR